MTTEEGPGCREDCYICHPGIPLPWWAFQSRRARVKTRVTAALGWFKQARSGNVEDSWRYVGMAEEAIRDAYNTMREE